MTRRQNAPVLPEYRLPESVEAELAVLGGVLTYGDDGLDAVIDIVEPRDFSERAHRLIFEVMLARRADGVRIDLVNVAAGLGGIAMKDFLGNKTVGQYLGLLVNYSEPMVGLADNARSLAEVAARRRLAVGSLEALQAIADTVGSSTMDVAGELVAVADEVMQTYNRSRTPRVSIAQAVRSAVERAEQATVTRGMIGVTTGVPDLDRRTHGLQAGQLIIGAGRPGMGKSTVALGMAIAAARSGEGVSFFSLEMDAVELGQRAVCAIASSAVGGPTIPYSMMSGTDLGEDQIDALRRAEQSFVDMPLRIETEPGLNLSQISARSRQIAKGYERSGSRLGLVVVDHLGLVKPTEHYRGNKVAETGEVSLGLKHIAKQLGCAVLALCQLSRGIEARDDKRPSMSDLRWAGEIEQDADMILGLYREAYYLGRKQHQTLDDEARMDEIRDVIDIEVLKQRSGPTGTVRAYCNVRTGQLGGLQR